MAQNRKPVPKSQKEISTSGVETYTGVNPNEPDKYSPNPNVNQSGIDFNRSEKLSRRGDNYKDFTVGIQDIDEALLYYFQNVIRPTVHQNGERIAVPIIYGAPERWKSFQKDGKYRDRSGKIMNPIIMFKRDNIIKKRNLTNKLDANNPNLYTSWQKSYNDKNFYSNFNVLNNRVQTKQFVANVVPDYVTLQYSVTIQTYYIEQLNKIIEAVNYASDSYWGDPERFKFNASIDQFNTIQELNDGQERLVRSTFTINMYGYIIPDIIQKDINSIKKYNDKSKVIFSMETTSDDNVFESNPTTTTDGRTRIPQNMAGKSGAPLVSREDQIISSLQEEIERLKAEIESLQS